MDTKSKAEGACAARAIAGIFLNTLQGKTVPVVPGACIQLPLKLLVAPVAVVR